MPVFQGKRGRPLLSEERSLSIRGNWSAATGGAAWPREGKKATVVVKKRAADREGERPDLSSPRKGVENKERFSTGYCDKRNSWAGRGRSGRERGRGAVQNNEEKADGEGGQKTSEKVRKSSQQEKEVESSN